MAVPSLIFFSVFFFGNLFIACHLSKIYLQLERSVALFGSKLSAFHFQKKELLLVKKLFLNLQNIKRNNFQFKRNLKINIKHELSQSYFLLKHL